MTIKASAALIFAAGLLVSFAAPLPATAAGEDSAATSKPESTTPAKTARPAARAVKKRTSHRKSTPPAAKTEETRKADESKPAAGEKQVADATGSALPVAPPSNAAPSVSNAYAQMIAADAPSDSASGMSAAMSEKANTVLLAASDKPADADAPAEAGVVASDQLNDFDRGLQAAPVDQPMTQTVAIATVKPTLASTSQAASNDSSTLDNTSMIGKIFIALGALLTVASAARMLMA